MIKQPPPKLINLSNSPNGIKELSTSSEAFTNDVNEGDDTVSTVKDPYNIKNNNTIEDDIADEVIIEAIVDNALVISIQSEAEALFVPWIDQEWWYLCQQAYL